MELTKYIAAFGLAAGLAAGAASASTDVAGNITVDTTWTKVNSPYLLKNPIYVINGASLTIEPGVVVVTLPADDGGLIITRDSQIFALGTKDEPIIFTSAADVATWTGSVLVGAAPNYTGVTTLGDPKTGTWREAASEWRNLTILGKGVISASHFAGIPVGPSTTGAASNPTVVDGTAQRRMEGTDAGTAGGDENNIRYGGAFDDDDSGVLRYVSTRYTGRVIGTGDELNGLSLGGVGSETDIDHLDIMNNVDDGIEIWGGKVSIKYVNIWNIGDDSFDVDEGWRGKVQFGLVVQGWAASASQGSGVGDNIFEMDGGELPTTQPTTSATFYNMTAIGQRLSGDGALTYRDNANIQIRKSVIMDVGEELIRFDGNDGDGGTGYTNLLGVDAGGTAAELPDFYARFTTAFSNYPQYNVGAGAFAPNASFYSAQVDGFLCEVSDCVFYNASGNYLFDGTLDSQDQAVAAGVVGAGFTSSVGFPNNVVATIAESPITSIGRDAAVAKGGLNQERVNALNPLPVNAALTCVEVDPANPFFTSTSYRGAFSPTNNWIKGWTAADAFSNIAITGDVVADPTSSIALSWSISFSTVNGKLYQVEVSTDGRTWTPVTVITGDGSTMTYSDTGAFANAKLYRVLPL